MNTTLVQMMILKIFTIIIFTNITLFHHQFFRYYETSYVLFFFTFPGAFVRNQLVFRPISNFLLTFLEFSDLFTAILFHCRVDQNLPSI